MDNYVTGNIIKTLRLKRHLTQQKLADIIGVSEKTISKWETGRGLPDISLLEPLSTALKISVSELINGNHIENNNKSCNMLKTKFYVCPICGNIVFSTGENLNTCCGKILPFLNARLEDDKHKINIEKFENECYISVNHCMSKEHYISFFVYITSDRCEVVKLYPEQNAEARFFYRGKGIIYAFCNKDGLIKKYI